jgi:hypothetical protein
MISPCQLCNRTARHGTGLRRRLCNKRESPIGHELLIPALSRARYPGWESCLDLSLSQSVTRTHFLLRLTANSPCSQRESQPCPGNLSHFGVATLRNAVRFPRASKEECCHFRVAQASIKSRTANLEFVMHRRGRA